MTQKIKAIYGPETGRENEIPWSYQVGVYGVTKIVERHQNHGDHTVGWFDVFYGESLHASMNARQVAAVIYRQADQ